MRFLDREWEPFDFSWAVEDGRLTDKAVGFGCMLAFGVAVAFGA